MNRRVFLGLLPASVVAGLTLTQSPVWKSKLWSNKGYTVEYFPGLGHMIKWQPLYDNRAAAHQG